MKDWLPKVLNHSQVVASPRRAGESKFYRLGPHSSAELLVINLSNYGLLMFQQCGGLGQWVHETTCGTAISDTVSEKVILKSLVKKDFFDWKDP